MTKYLLFRQFFKSLNPARFWNLIAVYGSYTLSKWTKNPIVWGMPFAMSIEPTTACNLGCTECPSGLKKFTRPTGNLKIEELERWLPQLSKNLLYVNFYFQGEPLIHPQITKAIAKVNEQKIFTAISTNAHFISPKKAEDLVKSGLKKVIISIDGITQESYEKYRVNGVVDKVFEGTRNLVEAKKKLKSKYPIISWQMVVFKSNENEIPEAKKLAKTFKADEFLLKTAQFYDYKNGHPLMPTQQKYSRYYKNKSGGYSINNKLPNHCWRLWQSTVLTFDGSPVPCCFDKDADYKMGNINKENFGDIWTNSEYQKFRKKVLSGRANVDICTNCSEGSKVWN